MPDTPEKPETPPSADKNEADSPEPKAAQDDDAASNANQPEDATKASVPKKRVPRSRKKAASLSAKETENGAPPEEPQDGSSAKPEEATTPDEAQSVPAEASVPAAEPATPAASGPQEGNAPEPPMDSPGGPDRASPPPPTAPRSARGWMIMGVMAVLLVVGGAAIWTYPWNGTLPPDDRTAFNAIGNKLTELEKRVDALENADRASGTDADALADLGVKIAALEKQVAELTVPALPNPTTGDTAAQAAPGERLSAALDMMADLQARLDQMDGGGADALQQRLQAMEGLISDMDVAGRLDALEQGLAAAPGQTKIDDMEGRIAALESGNDAQVMRAASLAMAVANLSRSAAGAAPFTHELTVVRALAPEQPQLAALIRHAETGVPTIATLRSEFPAFGRAAIRADRVAGATGWWGWLSANLQAMVTVRNIDDTEGETAPALVSRMENYLLDGQLTAALTTAGRLSPAAQEAMAPWLDQARPRAELEAAIAELNADVLSAIAATGSQE